MIDFIARYFSSLWELITAPFRWIWRGISKLFPERDCTTMDTTTGNVSAYRQNTFWRFAKFCVTITMCIWAAWSTYVYMYHRPLLQKRSQQLEQMKDKHNKHTTDLRTYLKKYNDLAHDLHIIDDKMLKSETLSDQEKDDLLKSKSKILGELDFLQVRVTEMMDDEKYPSDLYKSSELALELELVKHENTVIKQKSEDIVKSAQEIADADGKIVDAVSKLISDNITEIQNSLKRINSNIIKLGLTESKLITQSNKYSNPFLGSAYVPLDINKNADAKYKKIAQDLEKWSGLYRLKTILPTGSPIKNPRITSNFGQRQDPFTKKNKQHKGIDFAGKIGTELYAVAPGRVISAGERAGYGTTIEIDHGLGFTTLYAHLSKMMVTRGDWIRPGTVVGLGGSSGRSTGPHLHYEIRYKGTPFNPTKFVKE